MGLDFQEAYKLCWWVTFKEEIYLFCIMVPTLTVFCPELINPGKNGVEKHEGGGGNTGLRERTISESIY